MSIRLILDAFKRPLIAYVTLFAYANLVLFPMNSAWATFQEEPQREQARTTRGPNLKQVLYGLLTLQMPLLGAAQMTATNRVKPYNYTQDTPLFLAPYIQISSAVGGMVNVTLNTDTSCGNLTSNASTPDVVPGYRLSGTTNIFTLNGNMSQVNTQLNALTFSPINGSFKICYLSGTLEDNATLLSVDNTLTGTPIPRAPVIQLDLGTIYNGATVPVDPLKFLITDPNGFNFTQDGLYQSVVNGYFAYTYASATPANLTAQDVKDNKVIFKHAGNNQLPDIQLAACNPNKCSNFTNVQFTFVSDSPQPTSAPPQPTSAPPVSPQTVPTPSSLTPASYTWIASLSSGAVAFGLAVGGRVILSYRNAKKRAEYPFVQYLNEILQLSYANFDTGTPATFKDKMEEVRKALVQSQESNPLVPKIFQDPQYMKNFCDHYLRPELTEVIKFRTSSCCAQVVCRDGPKWIQSNDLDQVDAQSIAQTAYNKYVKEFARSAGGGMPEIAALNSNIPVAAPRDSESKEPEPVARGSKERESSAADGAPAVAASTPVAVLSASGGVPEIAASNSTIPAKSKESEPAVGSSVELSSVALHMSPAVTPPVSPVVASHVSPAPGGPYVPLE